ncbi:MAG: hypothetical protein QM808_02685 [Steroidobacteraceae bacterium]
MKTHKDKKTTSEARTFANHELVVVAAYLVGAHSSSADTEDIANTAHKISPGRFSWRKYDYPNIETVRKRLWDATKIERGAYLIGSEKSGWRLTKAGYDFASEHASAFSSIQPKRTRTTQSERKTQTREINRMLDEPALKKFLEGKPESITKNEAERFFRIDDYVIGKERTAKIERFRILVSDDITLVNAVEKLAALVGEKST